MSVTPGNPKNAPGVPDVLTEALELGPDTLSPRDFYLLLTALVVPRPIGWISTISAAGVRNVAPYSYFNLMGSEPFYCAFGSTGEKDSVKNIREVPQFVANIVTMDLLEKMSFTSGDWPRDQDEFEWAGLTAVPSKTVKPYRVGEAKAHLECEVKHIFQDGRTHIVIAKIEHVHVSPAGWKNGRVDPKLLEILVCPLSKGPLRYDAERQELVSDKAKLAYPIRDGIPIMLVDEARQLDP
jgi:flavin reductase (DIM6/NTAB) family NADH-FMN oxidoreductase RutF